MSRVRRYENLHILLWLIKDTSWLLEWKLLGAMMVVPTILVAIHIAYLTYKRHGLEFWIQCAVCMWICANSYWMLCEFNERVDLKNYAIIPFIFGFIATAIFYLRKESSKPIE